MRHTNFREKNSSFKIINKDNTSTLRVWKFTLIDGLTELVAPSVTEIVPHWVATVSTPDENCFMMVRWGAVTEILRVGDPDVLMVAYTGATLGSYSYTQYDYIGATLSTGSMVEIGEGFYYIEPAVLDASFYRIEEAMITLSVPYKVVNCTDSGTGDGISANENYINVGYNMFGFTGEKNSYHNGTVWVNDENSVAKASDLAKAVTDRYGLVWADSSDPLWIGNYVKYIRTYVENEGQFKLYSPSITPETNSNNFELMQIDEQGNDYIRGVSILLTQELETGGAVVPFKEV